MADENNDDNNTNDDDKTDAALKIMQDKLAKSVEAEKSLRAKVREFEAQQAAKAAEEAAKADEEARAKGEWTKIEEGYKAKLSEKEGEGLLWKSKYFERELDLGLTGALDEINVKPELRKAAMALLRTNADIDDDGKISLGDKPLSDAIKEWAKSDEGKAFIANGSSGGGANGGGKNPTGGDKNPWAKENWNLTEQGKIYKADPARARELARAAGAVPPG